MLKWFSVCAVVSCLLGALALPLGAEELPETSVTYRLGVELTPDTRHLDGWEVLTWRNSSSRAISWVPMHLHLNAFSHLDTTWMREGALNRFPVERFLDVHPDAWGWIEPQEIWQVSGGQRQALRWSPAQPDDGNPFDRSMIEVELAEPIAPGEELVMRVEFEARLPIPIARTGGRDGFFLVAQWFPKISVMEPRGQRSAPSDRWGGHQFHGPTEFYADFADFDVTITAPEGWLIAATGRGVSLDEGEAGQTVRYTQRAVHDFAFVVGDDLEEQIERYTPRGGGPEVRVRTVYPRGSGQLASRWREALHRAMDIFGERVGPYPYRDLTVVMPPSWAARTSGMEYPTFLTGLLADPALDHALVRDVRLSEMVLIHEFGHQYFYGTLATHEQEEALLDEGFNSYWEYVVLSSLYGEEASVGSVLGRPLEWTAMRQWRSGLSTHEPREPLRKRPSWLFYPGSWASQIYSRPALLLLTAERMFGADALHGVFAAYYQRWAFKHPELEDFLTVARDVGPPAMAAMLREGFERSRQVDYRVERATVTAWRPPLGRVVTSEGPVIVTPDNRHQHPEVGLDPAAREADGRVMMEVTDPGWVRPGEQRDGEVVRRSVVPEEKGSRMSDGYHVSEARVRGPGWDHLPVSVVFTFADGAVVRDRWDGRSEWRAYRFVRPAPLERVAVDPERRVALDDRPDNNALSVSVDQVRVADWSLWLGAAVQWIAAGVMLWL